MTNQSDTKSRGRRLRRWSRRRDARPAELIAAALGCFAERGFAATRLEDVAAIGRVSKGTVYLYFESKEKLFEAVVRAAVTPKLDQAYALTEAFEGTTPDLLRALLALYESALDGPFPAIAKLVIAESGNFPELARLWADVVLRRAFALFEGVVRRGVERGELRPVEPAVVAPLLAAPIVLLGLWKQSLGPHAGIELDPHAILREHAETILRGLSPAGPARPAPREPKKGNR